MGLEAELYKVNREKLREVLPLHDDMTPARVINIIFNNGYEEIFEEICFSSYDIFRDFFKSYRIPCEYEDTVILTRDIYETMVSWLKKKLGDYSLLDVADSIISKYEALRTINVYNALSKISVDWENEIIFFTSG